MGGLVGESFFVIGFCRGQEPNEWRQTDALRSLLRQALSVILVRRKRPLLAVCRNSSYSDSGTVVGDPERKCRKMQRAG